MQPHDTAVLAATLRQTGFMDLFQAQDRSLLEGIWSGGLARHALEEIVADSAADANSRFLAAEILFNNDPAYPPADRIEELAEIYTEALRHAGQMAANPWGLPGRAAGVIAGHVYRLGVTVVSDLQTLLDDQHSVSYDGSKEATIGNSYAYRVKDIAAELISHLLDVPFGPERNLELRDKAIQELIETIRTQSRLRVDLPLQTPVHNPLSRGPEAEGE